MEWKETKRETEKYIMQAYVVLLPTFEEPLASFVRSKRDGPSDANTYGSLLYIFVQNGFGTISEERSGEIARNRKQSCVRVAQVLSRDDARFVLCCWDSDFRRNLRNTIVSVGQRRSFFRITRCFDAVIALEAAKCRGYLR